MVTSIFRIRETTTADYPTIERLARAIWPEAYGAILSKEQLDYMLDTFYSVEKLTALVANENQIFLLVECDEKPFGFIGYEHHYQQSTLTRIHKIYVLPETQGRGIGKLLIQKVENLAIETGDNGLSLNVNRFNKALHFYKKLGFEITATEDIAIGHGWLMEDYRMEKYFP